MVNIQEAPPEPVTGDVLWLPIDRSYGALGSGVVNVDLLKFYSNCSVY